jgi:hypothetical protein
MQNLQEVAEQTVRMEGRIFIKHRQLYIASIGLMLTECLQLTITVIFREQLIIAQIMVAGVTKYPDITLPCPLKYSLERQ